MSTSPNSDDIGLMEELALSLLIHSSNSQEFKPRLFPGKIPEQLSLELPIPEQSHVLGTLTRSETQTEIMLESNLTSEDLFSFYRTHLTSQGWHELEDPWPHLRGGFILRPTGSQVRSSTTLAFSQESGGMGLTLNILPTKDAPLRLKLTLDQTANLNTRLARRQRQSKIQNRLPSLPPPQGAQQHSVHAGSTMEQAYSTTTLTTHLALDALAAHYADQLTQAGWTETETGNSGPWIWHRWHTTDEEQEPYYGLSFILKTPEKSDSYFLFVRVSWHEPENDQTTMGWSSSYNMSA